MMLSQFMTVRESMIMRWVDFVARGDLLRWSHLLTCYILSSDQMRRMRNVALMLPILRVSSI